MKSETRSFLPIVRSYSFVIPEAISSNKTAILLNPMAPEWYFRNLGLAYSMMGQHQEAISACEKAVRLAPRSLYTQFSLTMAYG
jgi:tetratricopeptide (TPR) repeat protein